MDKYQGDWVVFAFLGSLITAAVIIGFGYSPISTIAGLVAGWSARAFLARRNRQLRLKVVDFLRENRGKEYTPLELADVMVPLFKWTIYPNLRELEMEGLVQSRGEGELTPEEMDRVGRSQRLYRSH